MATTEQTLLLAVRGSGAQTLIIADGSSCREQIRHGAGRYAPHPIEVLQLALRHERPILAPAIEKHLQEPGATIHPAGAFATLAGAGALLFCLGAYRRNTRAACVRDARIGAASGARVNLTRMQIRSPVHGWG
jgi:hypothetical protein